MKSNQVRAGVRRCRRIAIPKKLGINTAAARYPNALPQPGLAAPEDRRTPTGISECVHLSWKGLFDSPSLGPGNDRRANFFAAFVLVALAALFAGCATKEPRGVVEYRQITAQALTGVQEALKSLDQVGAEASPAPKLVSTYSRNVQRLEVDSIQVRARARAILARGDAYFADWSNSIARIKNPRVRELADQSHVELEQSFSKIKLASQEAGAAFKPFLAGLRELRVKLEADPSGIGAGSAKDLMRKTSENGQQVVRELDAINSELNAVTTMLTPK
jgi:hypothetical protein